MHPLKKIEENHCSMIEGSPDQPKIKGEGNSSDTSFRYQHNQRREAL
jgi:hypothetical protein